MKRYSILLVSLAVCAAVGAPVPKDHERKLGPEWVKEEGGRDYIRKLNLIAVAQGGPSGYLCYSLPLEDHRRDLWVTECFTHNGKQLTIRLSGIPDSPDVIKDEKPGSGHPDKMAMQIQRTEGKDGKASEHGVLLGKVRYYDFDGDGLFDAMVDRRDEKESRSYILMTNPEGVPSWVRVQTLERKLNIIPVKTEGYKSSIEFLFDNGKWRVRTPEDKRKWDTGGKKVGEDKNDPDKDK
jgi:hypothetical protein